MLKYISATLQGLVLAHIDESACTSTMTEFSEEVRTMIRDSLVEIYSLP